MKLGLTGGLASGKSTVARRLAERGATVIDADRLVAELYAPGAPGARAAAELFGPAVLDERGAVDRTALARIVFADPAARGRLERAVHPLVRRRFARIAEEAPGEVLVLEATLLVEAGYAPDFDRVITVEAPEDVRLRRAVERGMEPDEARRRLAAQGSGETRRAAADLVIANDGDRAKLERRVDELADELGLGPDEG